MNRTNRTNRRALLAAAAACIAALLALPGCGGGAANAKLSGKVTYKGEPVPGTITLRTTISNSNTAADYPAAVAADGRFIVGGVPSGTYQVFITPAPANPTVAAGSSMPSGAVGTPLKHVDIPAKYLKPDTSGLTWEVNGSSQTKDFDLTD